MTAGLSGADAGRDHRRAVGLWLLLLAAMTFVMVVLGGATRLTGSGLSMAAWEPLRFLPPLTDAEWLTEYLRYQETPQYALVNAGMGIDAFKGIFWLEYVHRLWGRLIGLAFLLPFAVFAVRGWLGRIDLLRLLGVFALGGLQGLLGWLMVRSGLAARPEVGPLYLASHLFAGLVIYGALLWSALGYLSPSGGARPLLAPTRPLVLLLALVTVTVTVGGLVAGLHAGYVYNSFPLMNGRLVPPEALDLAPWWRNAIDNPALVQFEHRVLALLTWSVAMVAWLSWRRLPLPPRLKVALAALPLVASLQAGLGIVTLLLVVPAPLAAAHQAGAFLLFGVVVWALREAVPA